MIFKHPLNLFLLYHTAVCAHFSTEPPKEKVRIKQRSLDRETFLSHTWENTHSGHGAAYDLQDTLAILDTRCLGHNDLLING